MDTFKQNTLVKATLFQPEVVEQIKRWLEEKKGLCLSAFASFVCTCLNLSYASGKLQISSCADALKELDKQGLISLHDTLDYVPSPKRRPPVPRCLDGPVPEPSGVPPSVEQVKGLRIELVTTPEQIKIWNTILKYNHYLGPGIFFGRQVRYLVVSDHGYLGAVGFAGAAKSSRVRDRIIGWSASQRRSLLDRVLAGMNRFCILKSVQCRNLATKVLSLALEAFRKDFPAKYGFCPAMVESFVDPEHFKGTCYRAGNWMEAGLTAGRGRNDREGKENRSRKLLFLYTLDPGFREKFGFEPLDPKLNHPEFSRKGPLPVDSPVSLAEWAALEYGACDMGHGARNTRAGIIAMDIGGAVDRPYPEAAGGDRNHIDGYYYFTEVDQKEISFGSILSGPVECTWRRGLDSGLMRILQDGTDLNLDGLQKLDGLGVVGTNQTETLVKGLHLHTGLAADGQNRCLGVASAVLSAPEWVDPEERLPSWCKTPEDRKNWIWIKQAQLYDEHAAYMPDTLIVVVGDRECDFAGYHYAVSELGHVKSVVRACHDRRLAGECFTLFDYMRRQEAAGTITADIARQSEVVRHSGTMPRKARTARKAELEVRFATVRINPPLERSGEPPLALQCVSVTEKFKDRRPRNVDAVDWKLLTTLPVNSLEDVAAVVEHYAARWKIEEWHRIFKHGCKAEALACGSRRSLDRVLAFRVSEAARLMRALDLGRAGKDLPPEEVFTKKEINELKIQAAKKVQAPRTLADAVVIVASLAGYLDRKCDARPGYERFWRGYSRLQILIEGYDDGQKEAYERGVRDGEEIGYRRAKEELAKTRGAMLA